MKIKNIIATIVTVILINIGFAQNALFTDHGFIPDTDITIISPFQTAVYHDGNILIATSKGVWKNNIATQIWENVGLQDKKITLLYKHPGISDKIFAGALTDANNTEPLFVSNNGGITWTAVNNVAESLSNIVARPNNPNHLYAGTYYGYNFMISTDGGNNWVYYNNGGGGATGYPVTLAFLPSNNNQLFYGSENPMDNAELKRFDINTSDPTQLDNLTTIVDNTIWSNRRPDKLQTYSYTGNYVYVGQEGALSKVNTDSTNDVVFIYKSNGEPQKPYTYMYAHWTDPNDINHIVFGGNLNGDNTGLMQLYETYDEGSTYHRYTNLFGLTAPMIKDIVEINDGKLAIVIANQYDNTVKLIVMEPSSSSLEQNPLQNTINIYPNPTNDYIAISTQTNSNDTFFEIYNSLGQLIKNKTKLITDKRISLINFPKGIYFIKISVANEILTKKIVIM